MHGGEESDRSEQEYDDDCAESDHSGRIVSICDAGCCSIDCIEFVTGQEWCERYLVISVIKLSVVALETCRAQMPHAIRRLLDEELAHSCLSFGAVICGVDIS